MSFIYTVGLCIYYLGVLTASVFNRKARLWIRGRRGVFRDMKATIGREPLLWMHVASLGEFEQGRPMLEAIRQKYPQLRILLTFFSPSGYEIRKNYGGADYIYYLPLDTRQNALRFIGLIKPQMAIFVKYEFWPNYLKCLHQQGIPLYLVSGIFRPGQIFFKWYGGWYRKMLACFHHFFVQTRESVALLHSIGLTNSTLTGDTRFDRVLQVSSGAKDIVVASRFRNDQPCIIAGSTWPADEDLLLRYISQSPVNLKFIIAPHEVHEQRISHFISQLKRSHFRYSEAPDRDIAGCQVLIIDSIGLLSALYRYGDIAYIGGGFGKGIHNILEAAAFGIPVLFGPRYEKFHEAVELVRLGGAVSCNSFDTFKNTLERWLRDDESRKQAGKVAGNYVQAGSGATRAIVSHIFKDTF
jgi:3-deoxy-D-manno-octulosonic-acid transferase